MNPMLDEQMATDHVDELRRLAARRHHRPSRTKQAAQRAVELRLSRAEDDDSVRRLAALDEAPELRDPVLVALLDGDAVAALSLDDRRVVADPFVATAEIVALLRLRADHLLRLTEGRLHRRRWWSVPVLAHR